MGTYAITVIATTNATGNTEDEFIELAPATGVIARINRIRIFYRGDATAVGDNNVECRVARLTALGAGGVAFTPVKKDTTMPAATTVVKTKSGTIAFTLGTTSDIILEPSFNERGFYEWIPRRDEEKIATAVGAAGIGLCLIIKNSAASRQMVAEVVFDE